MKANPTNPTKSLSKMTNLEKKKIAERIVKARKALSTHLEQLEIAKRSYSKVPVFEGKKADFETLFEICDISLDALHGTPIQITFENPTQNEIH